MPYFSHIKCEIYAKYDTLKEIVTSILQQGQQWCLYTNITYSKILNFC